jgi:hypothetical protein
MFNDKDIPASETFVTNMMGLIESAEKMTAILENHQQVMPSMKPKT